MSRWTNSGAVLAVFILAFVARAYVPVYLGFGPTATIAWPTNSAVPMMLNNGIGPGMMGLDAGSMPVPAIDAGLLELATPSGINISNAGMTAIADGVADGTNLITFADTPANNAVLNGGLSNSVVNFVLNDLTEVDILGNAFAPWSTQGAPGRWDIQGMIVRQGAIGMGIGAGPMFNSSLWPIQFSGARKHATLTEDDAAGLRALYNNTVAGRSAIQGTVERAGSTPVVGAHVFLVDEITGRVGSSGLTIDDGSFDIQGVMPGLYKVYVEPIDGPFSPFDLIGAAWSNQTIDTQFQTTVLGGTATPQVVKFESGATVQTGAITVGGPPPTVDMFQIFYNSLGVPAGSFSFLETQAPTNTFVGIFGIGVHLGMDAGFDVSGPFVSISGANTYTDTNPNFDARIFPLDVPANTPPGAYAMIWSDSVSGELIVFPGCCEVLPGAQAPAYAAPYGTGCTGSQGDVILASSGDPTLGDLGFNLSVSNAAQGSQVYFVFSAEPDSFDLTPGCTVGIDLADLLLPIDALVFTAGSGPVTLPIPLMMSPGFEGSDIYCQALVADGNAPAGYALSNSLKLHFE